MYFDHWMISHMPYELFVRFCLDIYVIYVVTSAPLNFLSYSHMSLLI